MATDVSSIDDLLESGKSLTQPDAPEYEPEAKAPEVLELEGEGPEQQAEKLEEPKETNVSRETSGDEEAEQAPEADIDDYGNEKPKAKTYSEDQLNERINKAVRDRIARMERNNPQAEAPKQQAKPDFEYNPESEESWQNQLEGFVEQTVSRMNSKKEQQQQQAREQQTHNDFEVKFHEGMSKFNDFTDVVGAQNVTDAMTIATRSMNDPAAFLYAASKRHSAELQRISQLPDQYAQMVEIGKLEERMKKSKPSTKAPAPVSKTRADSSMPTQSSKEPTIEDLIAHADAKRLAKRNNRRR